MRTAGCFVTALSLLACASQTARAPAELSRVPVRITLERRPCYGTCPVYTVRVDQSGAVAFDGSRFVSRSGPVNGAVSADSVSALAAAFANGGFFELADRYVAGTPACQRYAADAPIVVTTITLGARTKRVEHDHGCTGVPPQLTALEDRVDSIAGTRRWIVAAP